MKKKYLKLTKKISHWFYSSRNARNLKKKKNDLSPPKFTLKRKLHTEKKSNQTLNNQYDKI